jgi:hypothetical protein
MKFKRGRDLELLIELDEAADALSTNGLAAACPPEDCAGDATSIDGDIDSIEPSSCAAAAALVVDAAPPPRSIDPCLDNLHLSPPALVISLFRLLPLPKLSVEPVRDSARCSREDKSCREEASLSPACVALDERAAVMARKSESNAALPMQCSRAILFHNAALSL